MIPTPSHRLILPIRGNKNKLISYTVDPGFVPSSEAEFATVLREYS
jgi:hypothetical protein